MCSSNTNWLLLVFNPALDKERKFCLYAHLALGLYATTQECQLQLLHLDTCPSDSKGELHFTQTLNSSESVMTFVPDKSALNLNW